MSQKGVALLTILTCFLDIFFFVILDILKGFCSNKHQIITDVLNYLDPIKS